MLPANPRAAGTTLRFLFLPFLSSSSNEEGKLVKRKKCTTKFVSGTVKFTTKSAVKASLSKNGLLYARGIANKKKGLVFHALRAVRAGRYTLTLRYLQNGIQVVARSRISIR
jgi:molybdopterin biosynthesis enzyme